MKKLIAILGLIILTITACAQNEWKYPLYVGKNGHSGGVIVLYGLTSGFTRLEVPAIAGNVTFRYPSTMGTPGQFLTTDGAGTMSWTTGGAGSMVYPAAGIGLSDGTQWLGSIANNSANWNTAYGWGNHATVGYVTGTPWTSMGYVTGTPWTSMGYLTSETSHSDVLVDGDFTNTGIMLRGASPGVYTILTNNSTNWNTAYGWGNHALAGYLTTQTSHADVVVDGDFTSQGIILRGASSGTYSILTDNSANWNTSFGWGNHASAGYAPTVSPIFTGILPRYGSPVTDTLETKRNTREVIGDSIAKRLLEATLAFAKPDSNQYGEAVTRTFVESLVGTGSGSSTQRLAFIIGTTAGAPTAGDSTIVHTAFDGKHVDIYRSLNAITGGAKQYQNFTTTNIVDGFRINSSTVTVNPVWVTGEQVLVDITDPVLWNYLSLEGEESSLLTGLNAYWKVDESGGTTVVDATGVQNGTTTATVNVAGKLNRAYEYDAASDITIIPYNTNVTAKGTAFSVSIWFKIDTLPTVSNRGNYLMQIGHNASPYLAHSIEVSRDNNKIFARSLNTSATVYTVESSGALSVDTWYHVVFVNRGNGQTLQVYLNGSDVSASAGTFTGTVFEGLATSNINFGNAYPGAPDSYLDGILDSFGIWGRALTSGEVTTLYNSGNGRTHPFN